MRWFNTAGPCKPADHYTLLEREGVPDIVRLVDRAQYFVIHAPRQTGKTTAVLQLARELTEGGRYVSVMVSVEAGAAFTRDLDGLEGAILGAFYEAARADLPPDLRPPPWPDAAPGSRVTAALRAWSEAAPRPLALFIDEIDALRDDALILVLRQLRAGFHRRPLHFPHSLGLVGLRDVRDYVVASGGAGRLGSASPFNIKSDSIRIGDFTPGEVARLLGMHTAETGKVFEPAAVARLVELTRGQPWLVNALAALLTDELVPDHGEPVTAAMVDRARDRLIERNDTHLDSLAERLREDRVRAVMEPILAGRHLGDLPDDDQRYVLDLGLVRESSSGGFEIANPIYAQVVPQVLSATARRSLPTIHPTWLRPDGSFDPDALLESFVSFWRRNGEPLMRSAPYHEIAPHLVLMAFLDRVANGGGRVDREYAIGSGRMDLLLTMGEARLAMELKVWRPGEPDPLDEGLEQLERYLAGLGLDEGWLVLFDRRADLPRLAERVRVDLASTATGRRVTVIRG